MQRIDWLVTMLPLVICGVIALYTRRYVRSVADFLAGGRNAGRYMLSAAGSELRATPNGYVASFQIFFIAGFTMDWWGRLSLPISLFLVVVGWVTYRYRETRAMTLGQFFEMRYSRKFRLFAGSLGFVAGLLGLGIGPIITADFLVYFLNLPLHLHLLGMNVSTALVLMAGILIVNTMMTTVGGQVTILITDCVEGLFSHIFYVFIAAALLIIYVKWNATTAALLKSPPDKSLVNPFNTKSTETFNIWYILIGLWLNSYGRMAQQHAHAFNASPLSAHESRMGNILGHWRAFLSTGMLYLLMICCTQYVRSPGGAAMMKQAAQHIADPVTRNQMRMPLILNQLLPVGVKGAFLATCLMGIVANGAVSLHSWSSIFIQDVIVPLRKTPLSTGEHLLLLRLAVIGVAVFLFIFSALFPQSEYVKVWEQVMMVLFTGGAGAAIIGGLYWKRGTTAGAWSGMLSGSILTIAGMVARIYWQKARGEEFPITGVWLSFLASIAGLLAYVIVSLLTCREPHNMQRLLHRGEYASEGDKLKPKAHPHSKADRWLWRIAGIDSEFTRSDRWVTLAMFWWTWAWVVAVAVGSVLYLLHRWSDTAWANFWIITSVHVPIAIGVGVTIWFTIGALSDIKVFFARLRAERVNPADDGTVAHANRQEKQANGEPVLAASQ